MVSGIDGSGSLLPITQESAMALIRYEAMCRAIDAAYQVDEVKDIRDRAAALEHYSRQARNTEAERQCCEIRLRAERKAGELLAAMEKAKAGRPNNNPSDDTRDSRGAPTLGDLGITYDQSSQWQKLAAVPEPEFEAALSAATKPTVSGIIGAGVQAAPKQSPVSADALWLWGRLRDFDRDGMLGKDPATALHTMTPEMIDDVLELAPRVVAWLGAIGEPS